MADGGDDGARMVAPPDALEWARMYRRIDNKPFSLARYKPLEQIYRDTHPYIAIRKPAQKGLSEYAVTRACHKLDVGANYYDLDKAGLNVGYIFSTKDALSSFSKERFSGLRLESDKLASLFTVYDAVGFKQAGESYLYFAGGKSVQAMKSFAADDLILDEYDEIPPGIVALAEVRLNESDLAHQVRLSTPTFPGKGIDAEYQQSDQNVWEVCCGHCGDWNELDFFRDVRADGQHYEVWKELPEEVLHVASMDVACPTCREPIDTLGEGRWTPRAPERKRVRGYSVPALSCGKVNLNRMAVKAVSQDPEKLQEFFRSDLGLPYEPKGARVTDAMLKQLSTGLPNGLLPTGVRWRNVTMGVDQGSPRFWYRISGVGPDNVRHVLAMGYVVGDSEQNVWQKLSDLMEVWHVRNCVVDIGPEMNASAEWAEKHKGKVLRASYPTTAKALTGRLFRLPAEEPDDADKSEEQAANVVQVNRTMAMDAVFNRLAKADERWPALIHNDPEVVSHMKAPVRVLVTNKDGIVEPRWIHTTPDDYFHTSVYDLIAQQTLPKGVPGALGLGRTKDKWGTGQ